MDTLDDLRGVVRRVDPGRPGRSRPEPTGPRVGGALQETEHGPVLTVRREYALDHRHGEAVLGGAFAAAPALLGMLTRHGVPAGGAGRLLFLDTETTGLAGGTGTYTFLVGAGQAEGDRFVVRQFFMRDLNEEPALLAALAPLVARADGLVTYNGSGFDVPLLETRFVLARRRWPDLWHLDLPAPARRLWGPPSADSRRPRVGPAAVGGAREAPRAPAARLRRGPPGGPRGDRARGARGHGRARAPGARSSPRPPRAPPRGGALNPAAKSC